MLQNDIGPESRSGSTKSENSVDGFRKSPKPPRASRSPGRRIGFTPKIIVTRDG